MHASLFKSNLTNFIDKPLADILAAADKKEESKLRKQDKHALKQIIMQCMPWVLMFIETALTAQDAWEALQKCFQPSSTSAKIFIKRDFYSTKLGKHDDVDEHIHKLCCLYQDLMIARFNMLEAKFTSVVLMSLPPSWDSFISMINGKDLESTDSEVRKLLIPF